MIVVVGRTSFIHQFEVRNFCIAKTAAFAIDFADSAVKPVLCECSSGYVSEPNRM